MAMVRSRDFWKDNLLPVSSLSKWFVPMDIIFFTGGLLATLSVATGEAVPEGAGGLSWFTSEQ